MRLRKHLAVLVTASALLVVGGGSASAAFPNFSDCPTSNPSVIACIDIQNVSGSLNIKGFNVPLGESLDIRGGSDASNNFIAPTDGNGLFATPVVVPGGLLGIEWIPGNRVLATAELAGTSSQIHINGADVEIPIRVRLSNALLGMNCHVGTDSNPIRLALTSGTTSPPPPNRPISGHVGTIVPLEARTITLIGTESVENSFAIPASSSCGFGLGLINLLVDAKLKLPSAAGNNSIDVVNNAGIKFL